MSNPEQLDDNTSYMADFVPLHEQEHRAIAEVTEILKATSANG
jgi:predicted aldo/keto reductase-like oxidoreductase